MSEVPMYGGEPQFLQVCSQPSTRKTTGIFSKLNCWIHPIQQTTSQQLVTLLAALRTQTLSVVPTAVQFPLSSHRCLFCPDFRALKARKAVTVYRVPLS